MADTRQRAYNRIDTSNPQGSWIDEKYYNRAGTGKGKTLVGNWLEEERLEGDMTQHGNTQTIVKQEGRYYKGGFESTSYLLSDREENDRALDGTTIQRDSFNDSNGDVNKQRKAALGVRSQIRAQMVLGEAHELLRQQEEAARIRDAPLTTTYRETVSKTGADGNTTKGEFHGAASSAAVDYASDVPVTVYTGNPRSGVRMQVPGLTSTGGTGNPLSKNTTFSHDKYAL
jgi:hypothetical protein